MPSIDWYGSYVNEAYIGKTKDILAMEKAIGNIRKDNNGSIYFSNVDTSEFNRLAEKVFGFRTYALQVYPSNVYNAYTIPIDVKLDMNSLNTKKNSLCDKNGFKYKKEAGYCCITSISSGLFFSDEFSDGEIMAIILHEIGHNFASVVDKGIGINQFIFKYIYVIQQLVLIFMGQAVSLNIPLNAIDDFKLKIEEVIRKKLPGLSVLIGVFRGIKGFASDVYINIMSLLGKVFGYNVYAGIVQKLTSFILKPTGYTNEKIADNFATVYGYGPEVATSLSKFERKSGIVTTDVVNEIPIIGDILALNNLPAEIILSAFDEHPIWVERSQDQVRLLENELKKSNLDPKMKKVINDNINEIKKAQDDYTNTYNEIHNATIYKRMWYSFIFDTADGDFRHNVFGTNDFDNIDKALGTQESTNLLDW